ncbi:hypothetical protein LCGC14_2213680, partial [marine sediment metagenome]
SGLVDTGNRHPFPVTDNPEEIRKDNLTTKLAVAHNGIFFKFTSRGGEGRNTDHSDTQNFVMEILSDNVVKNNLSNPVIRQLLEEFIGSSKLAFIDKTGFINLFGNYETEEAEGGGKIYFSNSGYKSYTCCNHSNYYKKYDNDNKDNRWKDNKWFDKAQEGLDAQEGKVYPSHKEIKQLSNKENEEEVDIVKLLNSSLDSKTKSIRSNNIIQYQTRHGGPQLIGTCENCSHYGNLLPMPGVGANESDKYFLCKKCRKKVRKGKLILEEKFCSSCNEVRFVSNLISKYNEFPLCSGCIGEYADV